MNIRKIKTSKIHFKKFYKTNQMKLIQKVLFKIKKFIKNLLFYKID